MSTNPLSLAPLVSNTSPAHRPGPETLHGNHVTLELLTKDHFPSLWENIGHAHSDLWTWWPDDYPSTASEFDKYMSEFSNLMPNDLNVYAVFFSSGPNSGKAVGLAMALSEERSSHRLGELGAFFGPALQKSRASTETLYILAKKLFENNHRRVAWKTNSLNTASRKTAERFGFVFEGAMRQAQVCKGRNRDTVTYSILDCEWEIVGKALEGWLDESNFDGEGRQRRRLEEVREDLMKKCM